MFMSDAQFKQHLESNMHMYELFERFALEAAKHRDYFSARAIFERMRWETMIAESNSNFKINNNWVPNYAKKFMEDHPSLEGFFRMRQRGE